MSATPPVTSNAKRQSEWRARQRKSGLVQVTVMVPSSAVADVKKLAERLAGDRDLAAGPVRSISTGKLSRL